jgi:hypothetical protein
LDTNARFVRPLGADEEDPPHPSKANNIAAVIAPEMLRFKQIIPALVLVC